MPPGSPATAAGGREEKENAMLESLQETDPEVAAALAPPDIPCLCVQDFAAYARAARYGECANRGRQSPAERQHPIVSSLTPFSTTEERPENKIQRLMLDIDFHPSTPEKIMTIPGSHGRKVELTRDEYDAFQEADRKTTERLQGLADRLKTLPPEQQKSYLERAYGDAARRVRERLYGTSSFRERARTALDAAKQERAQAGAS